MWEAYNRGEKPINGNKSYIPLHIAAQYGTPQIVQALLQEDADINATNQDGNTALYIAVKAGKSDIVSTLLRNKATINNITLLLNIAISKDPTQMAQDLLKERGNRT